MNCPFVLFLDFVTDNATDDRAANGAGRAATGQDGTADGPGTGANGGTLTL